MSCWRKGRSTGKSDTNEGPNQYRRTNVMSCMRTRQQSSLDPLCRLESPFARHDSHSTSQPTNQRGTSIRLTHSLIRTNRTTGRENRKLAVTHSDSHCWISFTRSHLDIVIFFSVRCSSVQHISPLITLHPPLDSTFC